VADDVVKVAGKRVVLAEIRGKAQEDRDVQDALVLALPEAQGRRLEIVALVVSSLAGNRSGVNWPIFSNHMQCRDRILQVETDPGNLYRQDRSPNTLKNCCSWKKIH
jgi:acyl-CoA synthetase (AMP-forming)/AMP-acid ligase II